MLDLTDRSAFDEELETLICKLHREDECVMPLSNWRVSVPGEQSLNPRLVGISEFDLRIRSTLPIKATPGMEFEISTPFAQHACVVHGDVHWSQRDGDEWEFGIFLTNAVPSRCFQRNPGDRRRSLRYPSDAKGMLTWDDTEPEIPCFVAKLLLQRLLAGFTNTGQSGYRFHLSLALQGTNQLRVRHCNVAVRTRELLCPWMQPSESSGQIFLTTH